LSAGWTELDLTLRPETRERVTAHGVRANPRISLPPGRYQVRIGARESVSGQTGSVFYDLEVPDFRKERLMIGGLLMTTPSVQQTPSIRPDTLVSKLLRADQPRVQTRRACALHRNLRQRHVTSGAFHRRHRPAHIRGGR
jgi:hypothetical protein